MRLPIAMLASILAAGAATAAPPESCAKQRALYPADWNAVSDEKPLFTCVGHTASWRIRLGPAGADGAAMLALVPITRDGSDDPPEDASSGVLRAWLDREQVAKLREGKYFAAMARPEESCWRGGRLKGGWLIVIDEARPPPDGADAGSFYNKAPRFSIIGDATRCEPVQ